MNIGARAVWIERQASGLGHPFAVVGMNDIQRGNQVERGAGFKTHDFGGALIEEALSLGRTMVPPAKIGGLHRDLASDVDLMSRLHRATAFSVVDALDEQTPERAVRRADRFADNIDEAFFQRPTRVVLQLDADVVTDEGLARGVDPVEQLAKALAG